MALAPQAFAQSATGKIQGKVIDGVSNAPVADVVVTATSPALQGEQTVVTDASGEFELPTLPPGAYVLHLEKEGYKPQTQPNVTVRLDKTVRMNLPLVPENITAGVVEIVGRAPTVDVGSTQTGATITDDFLNNVPVASPNSAGGAVRSFESIALVAPTTNEDALGVSVGGATSNENNYVIDGVNVTNIGFGTLGSPLSIDFIKEVNIITGGYMPEYGRATGGVNNVVTKSGGNEYHGSFSLYVQPGFLTANQKVVRGAGTATSGLTKVDLNANIGAEVGGYIIKDKLWFYVGLEPTITQTEFTRSLNAVQYQMGCPVDKDNNLVADRSAASFDHFSPTVTTCAESVKGVAVDGTAAPVTIGQTPIAGSEQKFKNSAFTYQYLAKLTYLLNQDQTFALSVFGNPTSQNAFGLTNATFSASGVHTDANNNDYSLRWNGSFLDKHVLAEASLGWYHDYSNFTALDPAADRLPAVRFTRAHSVSDFEPDAKNFCGPNDSVYAANERKYETDVNPDGSHKPENVPTTPYPTCRVTSYLTGGPGFLTKTTSDRYSGRLALVNLFRAAGHHEVKYGLDYEYMRFDNLRHLTGGVVLREYARPQNAAGGYVEFRDYRRYGYLSGPDTPVLQDSHEAVSKSTSLAGFAQDSWRVLDLFTLNFGIRWENQNLYEGDGTKVITLPNNIMPRVGAIYDWTGNGRSKIFANYGLFYEQVPLDILDRQFPTERQISARRTYTSAANCNPGTNPGSSTGAACQDPANVRYDGAKDPVEPNAKWSSVGGSTTPVDPNLKGQSTTEIVLGTEYEIFADARLGGSYTHRNFNRIIEDMSSDEGNTYFIGNPGYGIASRFPKAERNYDAGTIYFSKGFSHRWLVQASYTLSRLYGNYGGLFKAEQGQIDPNISSDFDLISLLANRTGVLSNDHTHNIKLFASYELPITGNQSLSIGGSYTGLSGGPTDYLGAHPTYGPGEAFILERGSGPRLPWIHEIDASFRYNFRFTDTNVLTASAEIFNLLNLREVTAVDQNYTLESVLPIVGSKNADDLRKLKSLDTGGLALKNPNFGNATAYQAPLAVRLGVKLTF